MITIMIVTPFMTAHYHRRLIATVILPPPPPFKSCTKRNQRDGMQVE